MKRTLEELQAEALSAETEMKIAQRKYYAAKDAVDAHPQKQQEWESKKEAFLRKDLPPYLFDLLVSRAENPITWFHVGNTCGFAGDDPCNIFEININFATGRGDRSFEIPYWDGALDEDNIDGEFKTVSFHRKLATAWKKALAANDNDTGEALAALVYAAAMHLKDPHPPGGFLRKVYPD